jgi:hypothetical protein
LEEKELRNWKVAREELRRKEEITGTKRGENLIETREELEKKDGRNGKDRGRDGKDRGRNGKNKKEGMERRRLKKQKRNKIRVNG